MYERRLLSEIELALTEAPAVVLLGPRQVGKTTLARMLANRRRPSIYLDLESEADRARLTEPALYLRDLLARGVFIVLDEIQRTPEIFATLRVLIDERRAQGQGHGQLLLLGSAAPSLLRQTSETLAGRVRLLELSPLSASEIEPDRLDKLWLRGGFPLSFLASSDAASLRWRRDFIRTYLEREIPQLGPRIPAETLRRMWTMLAHTQGGLWHAAELARALAVDGKTVARYLDLLVDLLLVRRLPPWHQQGPKRLIKSPKVYLRDSGLVHALLGIPDGEALLGHPVAGGSWEGMVLESLLTAAPPGSEAHFYRSAAGAEIDLLLSLPGHAAPWAIEIKRSLAPKLERGFTEACQHVGPEARYVVYAGEESFPLRADVEVVSVLELARRLRSYAQT